MFCNKCGSAIDQNNKFCNKCGNKVIGESNDLNNQNKEIIYQDSYNLNSVNNVYSNSNSLNGNYNNINSNVQNLNCTYSTNQVVNNNSNNNVGFYSNNSNMSTVSLSNKNANKKMIFIGIGMGLCIILILTIILYFIRKNNTHYYFDTTQPDQNNEIVVKKDTSKKKGKYSTVIISDHTYSGVKINNDSDAINLIVKDSVSQKDNCPSEIKKIEDEIINNYGITAVNLCEMDIEFARELGNVFKKIYNEYPSVRGYITNLTLVNGSMSQNYIAAFMPVFTFATSDSSDSSNYPWVIKTQILLNTTYFLNQERLESSVVAGSDSGHFPKNATVYSPVAHELGHYLSFLAMMNYYQVNSILLVDSNNVYDLYKLYDDFEKGNFSLSMINEAFNNYKKDTNSTMELDEWRGMISKYALAKDNKGEYIYDETIAESFHDVYLNGENASVASKYVVSVLKEKLGC